MVGVDGSRTSEAATAWAARLAEAIEAELIAVTAWQPSQAELSPDIAEREGSEVRARLDESIARFRDRDLRVRTEVVEGEPEQLEELANDEDVDVLVVGTHGLAGFTPLHLGSLTRHLARRVGRPLALIPDPADDDDLTGHPVSAIAVDVDETPGTAAAVDFCVAVAPRFGASVVALVTDEPEDLDEADDLRRRMAPLYEAGVETSVLIRGEVAASEGLLDLAGRVQLVVAGAEDLNSVLGLRFGGTAMQLLDQTRIPLVIVPPRPLRSIPSLTTPDEHRGDIDSVGGA